MPIPKQPLFEAYVLYRLETSEEPDDVDDADSVGESFDGCGESESDGDEEEESLSLSATGSASPSLSPSALTPIRRPWKKHRKNRKAVDRRLSR